MISKSLPFAAVFLALPAAAYAGHVESGILRAGTPTKWWKDNKTQVLDRLKRVNAEGKREAPVLEDLLGPQRPVARSHYVQAFFVALSQATSEEQEACWNGEKAWRADQQIVQKRYAAVVRSSVAYDAKLPAKAWMQRIHEALAGEAARAKRFAAFAAIGRVQEAIFASLQRMDRVNDERWTAEKEVADLVLILQFLHPQNKTFFLNGYSYDAINPAGSYAGLYAHLKWDEQSVEAVRRETYQVLSDMGSYAVPVMRRALTDYTSSTKDGGKTVGLPATSLATSTQWSTKEVRFKVPVHPSFQSQITELIAKAGSAPMARVDVVSVDIRIPKPAAKEEAKAPPAAAEPVALPSQPDPVARVLAERRSELLQYSGVQAVEAADGAIRIRVATEADANDLRLLLGDEALGFRIAIVVS